MALAKIMPTTEQDEKQTNKKQTTRLTVSDIMVLFKTMYASLEGHLGVSLLFVSQQYLVLPELQPRILTCASAEIFLT